MTAFDRSRQTAEYHAILLRLWREGAGGAWRASLQDAASGERLGFADVEHLVAYLLQITDDRPDTSVHKSERTAQ